jgi:multiple sugar transport system substrate-binding protein
MSVNMSDEGGRDRGPAISRRSMLKGGAGAVALSAVLAACSSSGNSGGTQTSAANTGTTPTPSTGGGSTGSTDLGTTTVGSNYSDNSVRSTFAAVVNGYTGGTIKVNTVDHDTFQNNIQTYLQGSPNDVFTWFSGYRAKFFADQGLLTPIDDVWEKIGDHFTDAVKAASKGSDGKYYLVPWINYPWVMFYKKSVFAKNGYKVPGTWDDLISLCKQMQSDGFANPIAIGQKDGWPAMGTFDIINMRMNGYQFHIDLMAHKVSWDDQRVKNVFKQWQQLTAYYTPGANGRTYQETIQLWDANKTSALVFHGTDQVLPEVAQSSVSDLAFFPFPQITSKYPTDSGIDAPIDGFLMSAKVQNKAGATAFMEYLGTAKAEETFLKPNPADIGTATDYDTSTYTPLQKQSVQIIKTTKNLAQFLDRDTRPDFAYPIVQNALNGFLNDPSSGDSICSSLEAQAQHIFT